MYTLVSGVDIDPEEARPRRQSDGAVGFDLKAYRILDVETREELEEDFPVTINPGEVKLFGTGIIIAIPESHDGQIRPRSGLARRQIYLANSIGTIDPDYRGDVSLLMLNGSNEPYVINKGDRIAQFLLTKVELPEFQYVSDLSMLPETRRGTGGFGSTGVTGEGLGTGVYDLGVAKLDRYFMRIVLETAKLSTCIRGCELDEDGKAVRDPETGEFVGQTRRFGCVFAVGTQVVASGFNHEYPGSESCSEVGCMRTKLGIESGHELEKCRAIHAEPDAIIAAANRGISLEGSTMYVNAEPCLWCARDIASLGIEALVVLDGGYSSDEGLNTVRQAGIQIRHVKMDDLRLASI